MRQQRVTVIGATGFVGRYVVKHLAHLGALVRAASRHAEDAGFLRPMGDVGQVTPIAASLLDERALAAVVRGADAVVNCVGILYERGSQRFAAVHQEGPERLARAAKAASVKRLVHISALSADPASPSAYARSKAAGEAAVRAEFPEATILRPSAIFGPEDQFFNRFAALARYLPALPLIGGGHTRFAPVYVGDVASAVVAALQRAQAQGSTYDLGGPEVLSFRELMERLLAEIRRRRLLIPIPFGLASFEAFFLERLPNPPLTRDQVELLKGDAVARPTAPGLADLGIEPTALELVLPSYLQRYRKPSAAFRVTQL